MDDLGDRLSWGLDWEELYRRSQGLGAPLRWVLLDSQYFSLQNSLNFGLFFSVREDTMPMTDQLE